MSIPPNDRVGRPWWTFAIPYPGPMPKLPGKHWRVLGLLSVAELFDHYDMGLLSLALSQIQAGLGIPEQEIAGVVTFARLGMLFAFALTVMADRVGRRRLLLLTIAGFTLCTFATGFARDAREFMWLQFVARMFMGGETMLAVVVIAEELYARDRGFGIGLLAAMGALGNGLAAIVFTTIEVVPYGWRSLYLIGVVPMLLLTWFRRGLKETERFSEHRRSLGHRTGIVESLRPVVHLARMYPGRISVLSLAVFPFDFVATTAYTFIPKTLQEVHGYSPGDIAVLYLTAGGVGILGNIYIGILGDRFGRRAVMCVAMLLNGLALVAFYNASGWWLPPLWLVGIFTIMGIGVLFKALGTELFPTSYRSTASGMRLVVATLGGAAGLAFEGPLYALVGSHALAITYMTPVLIFPPLLIGLFLPETAARELEEVSPERAA